MFLQFVCCAALSLTQAGAAFANAAARKGRALPARSRQLVVVTTRDWASARGTLRRFERGRAGGRWVPAGEAFEVVVGQNGMGWGAGANAPSGGSALKKEGDGKAPAGVFPLGPAFGFADAREASWLKLPYKPLAPATECVDDAASRHYNSIVERGAAGAADWNSSERMRSVEGYRWGLVVGYNTRAPVPGRGSCIFLHVWDGPEGGTAGCTAMERSNMEVLLHWLDAAKRPLLVQLPEEEYARLRPAWRLPPLAVGR